jgi:phosphoribosyl 1,2-cyclic phosphodiesterase
MFKIRFWGDRGSYPVPGERTLCYGGNTSCVEVIADGAHAIFDAGTGIINLGKRLMREADGNPIVANIFFSHTHRDHTEGLPFFDPAYIATTTLHVFGPKTLSRDLHETLAYAMLPPFFPVSLEEMKSTKLIKDLLPDDAVVIDTKTNKPRIVHSTVKFPDDSGEHLVVRSYHGATHPGAGIYIYSAEYHHHKVIYATDTEGCEGGDLNLIEFARNADILIHDAQFLEEEYSNPKSPKKGWGHSTLKMAAEVARKANVRKLVLFHHDPESSDEKIALKEKIAQAMFAETIAAYEGLDIVLSDQTATDSYAKRSH